MRKFGFINLDCLEKSLFQGAAAGGVSVLLHGTTVQIDLPYINQRLPLWVITSGLGVLGSFANDLIHFVVKPEVHLKQKAADQTSMILAGVVGAVSYTGGLYLLEPRLIESFGYINSLLLGAGSELAGSYAFHLFRGD